MEPTNTSNHDATQHPIIEQYQGPLVEQPLTSRPTDANLTVQDSKASADDEIVSTRSTRIAPDEAMKLAWGGAICTALAAVLFVILQIATSNILYDVAWIDNTLLRLLISPLPIILVGLVMSGLSLYLSRGMRNRQRISDLSVGTMGVSLMFIPFMLLSQFSHIHLCIII
jgi:hypothetical protein